MMIFLQSPTIKLSCKNLLRICRTVIQAPFLANLEAAALNWKRLGCTRGAWTQITCCWGLLFKGDSKTVDQRTQKPNPSEHGILLLIEYSDHVRHIQWGTPMKLINPWPSIANMAIKNTETNTTGDNTWQYHQTKQHPTLPRSHEPVLFPPWHDGHGTIMENPSILNGCSSEESKRYSWINTLYKALRVDQGPEPGDTLTIDEALFIHREKDEKRRSSEVLRGPQFWNLGTSCHVLSHLVTSFPGPSAAHPQGDGDAQEHCFASRLSDGRLDGGCETELMNNQDKQW